MRNGSKKKQIFFHTICYIQSTKRFERSLIDQCELRSITTVLFFPYMYAKALSVSQILNFFERMYWIFQLLYAALECWVSVGWCCVLGYTNCIILFSLVSVLLVIICHLYMLLYKKEGWTVQRVHLNIWGAAGHGLIASGTVAHLNILTDKTVLFYRWFENVREAK